MKKQKIRGAAAAFMAVVLLAAPASAVQSPAGCNGNRLNLSLVKDKTAVQQGETITYTVTVSNLDAAPALACDIDTANVTVTLPAADGTPTGTAVTLVNNANYPAGYPITLVSTVPYVVSVNAGVTDVVAQARVTGVLHDAPLDHAAEIIKTVGTAVLAASGAGAPTSSSTAISTAPQLPNAGVSVK